MTINMRAVRVHVLDFRVLVCIWFGNVVFAYVVVRNGGENTAMNVFCLLVCLLAWLFFSFAFAYTVLFANQFAFISLTDDDKLCAARNEKSSASFWCLYQLIIKMIFVFICFSHSSHSIYFYLLPFAIAHQFQLRICISIFTSTWIMHMLLTFHIDRECIVYMHDSGKYSIFRMDVFSAVYISICLGNA